jgi:beta-phosphoglucomutase-like phosphatase (HAD superfamily)
MQQVCAPYGKNFSTETKSQMMGKSALEAGQILIRRFLSDWHIFLAMFALLLGELNLPMTEDEFLLKSNELYQQAFPAAEFLPGAERLIRHLAENNIPMGTNQSAESFLSLSYSL